MDQPERDTHDSLATRASLLGRLRNWEDGESWEEFTQIYWRLIYSVGRGAGLSDADARDLVQETLLGVARKIHEFESDPNRGTFRGWLLNLTRWRIADHYRAHRAAHVVALHPPSEEGGTPLLERVPDPAQLEAVWESEWKKNVFDAAWIRVIRRINPKHAQIFDLFAVRAWPAAKVALHLGISRVQVYLVNHRVARLLKREVRYLQRKLE